jgi:alpha-ketoglutarate-dependent taurine dioxygenase
MQVMRDDHDLDLVDVIESNSRDIERILQEFGVIIFKGYDIDGADKLRRVARAFSPNLLNYNERAAPRKEVLDKVYTSTEFPKEETIPLHHEMAYSYNYPRYLYFCCSVAAQTGGVTPVADNRVVMSRIPKPIKDKFVGKKIMYVRNFGTGVDMEWQTAFQTDSKAEVEKYLTDNHSKFRWHGDRRLETQFIVEPILSHPNTGESVWFNHAHLFHSSNLPGEVRAALVEEFSERGLPRNVFYGNGDPIEDEHLEFIRNIYSESAVGESWERGDFLLVDNLRSAHGRTSYTGAREIYVCMSDMMNRDVR